MFLRALSSSHFRPFGGFGPLRLTGYNFVLRAASLPDLLLLQPKTLEMINYGAKIVWGLIGFIFTVRNVTEDEDNENFQETMLQLREYGYFNLETNFSNPLKGDDDQQG